MAIDAVGTRQTPQRHSPYIGGAVIERLTPAQVTITSATTPVVLTAAQLLKSIIPMDCQDTGGVTLPTAALICAARTGLNVGDVLRFTIVNYGDSTCTVGVGTGITNLVIDSEDAILTVATHYGSEFALTCTGRAQPSDPSTSDTFDLMLLNTSVCTS